MSLDQGTIIRVGGPYFSGDGPYDEGIEFNYTGGNWMLTFSYPDLTRHEIEDLGKAACQFGVFVENGIIFFLCKFGTAFTWCDCPYNWWLVSEEYRTIPEAWKPGERCLLQLIVVNSIHNRVLRLRSITIPPLVSEKLVQAIQSQTENFIDTGRAYNEQISQIRQKYTSEQMASLGICGRGGD